MRVDILTLFPQMFTPLQHSMMWKAQERGLLSLHLHDIREYATSAYRQVDDTPYGGGGGMVMKVDVIARAVEAVRGADNCPVILMGPIGRVFNHQVAVELAQFPRLLLLCGHYEGVDERVRDLLITDEISIGDYVLTGGELAAMVIVDAVVRQIPGVLGAEEGAATESYTDGLLEGPHYTRPLEFRGLRVPDVLRTGNHAAIARWRRKQALLRTLRRRPDLLMTAPLSDDDRYLLGEVIAEARRL
jgi:tRNA (guanine37-N1)-methyltransferase